MATRPKPPSEGYEELSEADWGRLEARVRAFEDAWAAGRPPLLADHLAAEQPLAGALLVELVHADLHFRHKAGQPVRVAHYVEAFPALAERPDAVEGLYEAERRLRARYGHGAVDGQAPGRREDRRLAVTATGAGDATRPEDLRDGAAEALRLLTRTWRHPLSESPARDGDPRPRGEPVRVGRFEVERLLGHGGFGVVYLATDPALRRPVALKVPQPHILADAGLRQRFLREARATAVLEHPNIVPVYEAGEAGRLCYIVSSYCPGENLAERLARSLEPMPVRTAAAVVAALAEAVEYSHRRGILHRDLKPANVMLVPRPDGPTYGDDDLPFMPRLTDFGLAKVAETGLTETGSSVLMGTPLYMSPEQADGGAAVGPAADVYSLGVILYELLAGRTPFAGTMTAVLEQVRSSPPPPLGRSRAGVPRDLEMVCLKCLNKDPRHRYGSAGELADDLRRFLAGEPVRARPLAAWQRVAAWAGRPERMRDAGVYAIVVNVLILLWMTINHVTVVEGWVAQPAGFDPASGLRDSLLVGLATHLPMIAIGRATLLKRGWAVRGGLLLSALLVAIVIGVWADLLPSFGGTYEDLRLRVIVFAMLFLLFGAQLLLYVAAETARRRAAR